MVVLFVSRSLHITLYDMHCTSCDFDNYGPMQGIKRGRQNNARVFIYLVLKALPTYIHTYIYIHTQTHMRTCLYGNARSLASENYTNSLIVFILSNKAKVYWWESRVNKAFKKDSFRFTFSRVIINSSMIDF